MTVNQEQDQRLQILNTLLTTPHRNLNDSYPMHQQIINADPLFYVRLAAWYFQNGEIRDHKELFIVNLCMSSFEGHRDVGLAMLRELPPYNVARVIRFIKGHTVNKIVEEGVGRRKRKRAVKQRVGLFRKNLPGSMLTELEWYLKEREEDTKWFDSSVAVARKYMKFFYKQIRKYPFTERAQKILFDNEPPEDSSLFVVKNLSKLDDPVKQAEFIIKHKVPYRVAQSVITTMTPTVILALIEVMSDQELINSIGSLKKRGAFDNPDLKDLIKGRLEKAKKSKKVAALKSMEAVKASGVGEEIAEVLEEVADEQVKAKGRITRPTALFVDKSQSMGSAIELGKRIASMISTAMDTDFYCYAFDAMAYPITSAKNDLASWEKAFAGIHASGRTRISAPLLMMQKLNQKVEQILLITDEGECEAPRFSKVLKEYAEQMGEMPSVIIARTGIRRSTIVQDSLKHIEGLELDIYDFDDNASDYYALPQLVSYLSRASKLDLLMDIMVHPLPERKYPPQPELVEA